MQRAANRVRVSAQLIDAKTDTHLWVESYDRPLDDVFAIQSDIAKAIADQLQAKLSAQTKSAIEESPLKTSPPTSFTFAQNCSCRRGFSMETSCSRPHVCLIKPSRATRIFFSAYCLSAEANSRLYRVFDHKPARRDLADRAVRAALRLRPEAGEAHLEQARYLCMCNLDYDQPVRNSPLPSASYQTTPRSSR